MNDPITYTDGSMFSLPGNIESVFGNPKRDQTDLDMAGDSKRARTDTSGLSQSDRKGLDRERNRLHARNTRARKKQYMEELQAQLQALTETKEAMQARDAEAMKKLTEKQTAWRQTVRKVFDMRAAGEINEDAWAEVLSEDLKFILPVTPYRSFNPADVVNNRRVMLGIDGMIADTQSLVVTCDNIGRKTRSNEGRVTMEYMLGSDGNSAFFSEEGLMCTFMMRSVDAKEHGAQMEVEKSGMLRARFNADGKIEELEMAFDGIAFYHQLMRAQGKDEFPLVPNTLANAMKNENDHIVITTFQRPFRITHVNKAWTNLCGFELEECEGKNLSILQGPETDMSTVKQLCELTQKGYPASMVVTNYNKKGEAFRNHLRCYPVMNEEHGQVEHIVGVLDEVPVGQ